MNPLQKVARLPLSLIEYSNILLTTEDAQIGATPRDEIWTHRKTTLYRYRSADRRHPVPILLVFALINRPDIFDLRPGNSFVEYLLTEGFDVYLVDWGVPDDADADMGIDNYVCDELPWAIREVCRSSGQDQVSLIGWCIGAALSAMHCALAPAGPVRNAVLLTMPIDTDGGLYTKWVRRDNFEADLIADTLPVLPGRSIDVVNKMMKPVTNYYTTYRRLFDNVMDGNVNRVAYQSMAKWVGDNPPFPSRAWQQWIAWMYQENRLVRNRLRLRGRLVDLRNITQNLLVVTAGADHIAPRYGTMPFLDRVASQDVTHFDRPGGHIGLMAGSKAKREIWPDIAGWLAERSGAEDGGARAETKERARA